MKRTDIPKEIYDDIAFMLGDNYECQEFLGDILAKHGFEMCPIGFDIEEMPDEVVEDIYREYYGGE